MRKLFLGAALIIISAQAKLYAQTDDQSEYARRMNRSKTDQTYNAWEGLINIRDFVTLKEGRLILELHTANDYESFRNMDSILTVLRKDIAFYKDSLAASPTSSMRIDYVLNTDYPLKKIRFIKHDPTGQNFMNRDGEIAKLKYEQDTIHIVMQKMRPGLGSHKRGPCMIPYSIQATFVLGNYYDIDKVIADSVLGKIVDTLEKASPTWKMNNFRQWSITYNPYYYGPGSFKRYGYLMSNEYDIASAFGKPKISFNPQFGGGLVRNTTLPVTDIAFQYNKYMRGLREKNIYRISATGYYFFDKDTKGNFVLNDNWFANIVVGSVSDRPDPGWYGYQGTFGIGYLVSQKGGYFKNNTFRVFTDIMVIKGLSFVPEIIFTDNFKQVLPGITLKVLQ